MDDPSILIHLEREYSLKIREEFSLIDNEISKLMKQTRKNYDQIRKMIQ